MDNTFTKDLLNNYTKDQLIDLCILLEKQLNENTDFFAAERRRNKNEVEYYQNKSIYGEPPINGGVRQF